jgi:hypothetical protein
MNGAGMAPLALFRVERGHRSRAVLSGIAFNAPICPVGQLLIGFPQLVEKTLQKWGSDHAYYGTVTCATHAQTSWAWYRCSGIALAHNLSTSPAASPLSSLSLLHQFLISFLQLGEENAKVSFRSSEPH